MLNQPARAPRGGRRARGANQTEGAEPAAPSGKAASRGTQAAAAVGASPDLRTFTQEFFTLFGATVRPLDNRKLGPLQVELQGELAEHFGAERLGLAFQSVEAGSGHQLVAHGSRTFDRMLSYLERRAALTVRRLPTRTMGSDLLMRAVRPLNAGVAGLKLAEQQEPIYLFHWRLTYRADDKREELYTVILDDEGKPLIPGAADSTLPPIESLLADSVPAQIALASGANAEADAESPAGTGSDVDATSAADGSQGDDSARSLAAGRRLPPMTQLVRMAERARQLAIYHADLRSVEHEAEILPRLYKQANRLTNYYVQQMEELPAGNGERLEALQADLARKVAEEVENHRLRVVVDLAAYAILFVPMAGATLTLSDGRAEATVRVRLNRYTGHLLLPTCHACGAPVSQAVLCRNGHVACDECLRQCARCNDVLCAACGVAPCSACGRDLCDRCGRTCWACGERACDEHLGRCPTCGDEVCDACRTPCAECGSLQCRSHLRADAVVRAEDGGVPRLICAQCGVRCPGCNQYSARMATCSLSGQRFCANCVAACSDCGRTIGPGFYAVDAQGRAWCRDCARICSHCGSLADTGVLCAACGVECCPACVQTCSVCGGTFCSEHAGVAAGCGHVLCDQDALICATGGEVVCPLCSTSCAICGQPHCAHHQARCVWCGEQYCSSCVDGGSEVCNTCRAAATEGTPVEMRHEPCGRDISVAAIAPFFTWARATNPLVTVYFGHNQFLNLLVVVREGPGGRLAVATRRIDASSLRAMRQAR